MATFGAEIPFVNHCGIEDVSAVEGVTRLKMPIRPEHLNNIGVVHGGAICTLADVAMGSAGRSLVGSPVLTLDMQVSFLKAGREGVLIAEGRVLQAGRSIVFCEAEIRDEAGDLVAKSTGVFKRRG